MSTALIEALNHFVNDPRNRPYLIIIKGIRNGIIYGCKIRFPHALVMTLLFRNGSLQDKIKAILLATYTHATNLARFVVIYKFVAHLIRLLVKEFKQYHTMIAAFFGGYFVFGTKNNINEQINMYLLSRILFGLTKLAKQKGIIPKTKKSMFPWFSAIVWAIVLWLFEYHRHTLQPSLQASMTYLYHDSERWTNFRNFLIYDN